MLPIPALADRHDRQHNGSQRRAAADQSVSVQHAVPRAVPPHQVVPAPRTVLGAPRYQRPYAPRYSSPVIVAPRVVIPRVYAYRPYVFRPRFSLGFGVFVGYPVPYTYPYPYSAPIYGYPYPAGIGVVPGPTTYGGVSLDVVPTDAAVYVDGTYAGIVSDFDGTRQPLTLVVGMHRIEVDAAGFQPLIFDVMVQPGQVIPYRGDLPPAY
jgi:hypothetical protein